jgi:hypothetical protein
LRDHRLRRLVMVFDRNGIGRAASLAMTARRGSGSDVTFSKDRANVIRSAPTLDARLPVAGAGGP